MKKKRLLLCEHCKCIEVRPTLWQQFLCWSKNKRMVCPVCYWFIEHGWGDEML
jgi:hypothetical protein